MKKMSMLFALVMLGGCLGDPDLPQKPQIVPDRTAVAFGGDFGTGADAVYVGTQVKETLQLRNDGLDELDITGTPAVSGPNADLFTVEIDTTKVASRGKAFVQMTYAPTAAGQHTATLTITSNAENTPTLTIPLTATAVAQ